MSYIHAFKMKNDKKTFASTFLNKVFIFKMENVVWQRGRNSQVKLIIWLS